MSVLEPEPLAYVANVVLLELSCKRGVPSEVSTVTLWLKRT